ncbi:MAG TPA: hypothetical protein VF532_03610 [Candidatus Angelobacter sp.]
MSRTLALFCLAAILSAFAQQKPVLVPDGAAPADWHSLAPTFTLTPATPGGRSGQVWVRKNSEGLLIAGHINGPAPTFAANPSELMSKEHIEIWLAVEPNPSMPVMGWGNQFGDLELPKGEISCAEEKSWTGDQRDKEAIEDCQKWARKQKSYRAHLKRLFVRQWQLAPRVSAETFAAPAYHQIEQIFAGSSAEDAVVLPKQLKPAGAPELKTKLHPGAGYDFETLVPWKLFPPAGDSLLQDMYLVVEDFGPAPPGKKSGPYSTTAPGRGYADFAGFSRIQFSEARRYEISPCRYPSPGLDFWDVPARGYFFPSREAMVVEGFALDNHRGGYAYEPSGLSPEARPSNFFWKESAPGEYVCGPALRYFKAGQGTDLKIDSQGKEHQVSVDKDGFDVRRLPGGPLLVRNGPHTSWSRFGSGQCGACPRAELVIYRFDDDLKFSQVLNIYTVVGNEIEDMDIQISPDWARVGIYRHMRDAETEVWEDEFYCLNNGTYQKCGNGSHVPPPEPRALRLYPEDR